MPRTAQTLVRVTSAPPATVLVNGLVAGRTPLSLPLTYRGSLQRYERRVAYWRSEPGVSLLLTLTSLGVYLPFGLIPVDPEERLEVIPGFVDNRFLLRLEESGYVPWEQTLELAGEDHVDLRAELVSVGRPAEESL